MSSRMSAVFCLSLCDEIFFYDRIQDEQIAIPSKFTVNRKLVSVDALVDKAP